MGFIQGLVLEKSYDLGIGQRHEESGISGQESGVGDLEN